MVTQQRQLRAAHSLEELPEAGRGDGAKEPGSGSSGQRSLSCPPPPLLSSSWLRFGLFGSKG